MKTFALSALVLGYCICVYAQQWCFSNNCPETKATIFSPGIQLQTIFRAAPAMPTYTPVAPLRFSPATRLFFLNGHPLSGIEDNFRLPGASNVVPAGHDAAGAAIGTHHASGAHSASPSAPSFSSGQIGFMPH